MLEMVGHPYAVNPDKELRRIAQERGWPVLVFDKPVALRSRVRLPPAKPTLAALAVGGVAASAQRSGSTERRRADGLTGPARPCGAGSQPSKVLECRRGEA